MRARKQQTTLVHDISGVKIYEDDDSDNHMVVTNNDDTDDCYQTIMVMNRFVKNWHGVYTFENKIVAFRFCY